jgi:hypothetical protein
MAIKIPNTYITLREQKKFSFQGWKIYGKVIRIGQVFTIQSNIRVSEEGKFVWITTHDH